MKVNYHFHSGVSVETGGDLFIFDYYKKGFDSRKLNSFNNIYVFVSHRHKDHFDKIIFEWSKFRPDINYIFSYDIHNVAKDVAITFMSPGDELKIRGIAISALDSTDDGVAFFVKTQNGNIFHSGDLNWWHWEGESDKYNREMALKFKGEINKLSGESIDVAFIPVDMRLGDSMYYSIDYLMSALEVNMVCPIHFWDDAEYLKKVRTDLANREYYNKINFYEGQI